MAQRHTVIWRGRDGGLRIFMLPSMSMQMMLRWHARHPYVLQQTVKYRKNVGLLWTLDARDAANLILWLGTREKGRGGQLLRRRIAEAYLRGQSGDGHGGKGTGR